MTSTCFARHCIGFLISRRPPRHSYSTPHALQGSEGNKTLRRKIQQKFQVPPLLTRHRMSINCAAVKYIVVLTTELKTKMGPIHYPFTIHKSSCDSGCVLRQAQDEAIQRTAAPSPAKASGTRPQVRRSLSRRYSYDLLDNTSSIIYKCIRLARCTCDATGTRDRCTA